MKHRARKRFGQNFLVDTDVIQRCVASIAPQPGELVVEIGPGLQALTRPLAATGAELILVEIDRDLAGRLDQPNAPWRVVNEDALKVDFGALAGGRPYRLVGNLPYNISTPILFHLLAQAPLPGDMHFMLQKEVVDRMAAGPGSKTYGRLSLMCRNRTEVTPLFSVPGSAFDPPPRVESAFVRLSPRAQPLLAVDLEDCFGRVVSQAFSQRRKTLRNSLKTLLDGAALERAGVDPSERPEQLDFDAFSRLAAALHETEAGGYDGSQGDQPAA